MASARLVVLADDLLPLLNTDLLTEFLPCLDRQCGIAGLKPEAQQLGRIELYCGHLKFLHDKSGAERRAGSNADDRGLGQLDF